MVWSHILHVAALRSRSNSPCNNCRYLLPSAIVAESSDTQLEAMVLLESCMRLPLSATVNYQKIMNCRRWGLWDLGWQTPREFLNFASSFLPWLEWGSCRASCYWLTTSWFMVTQHILLEGKTLTCVHLAQITSVMSIDNPWTVDWGSAISILNCHYLWVPYPNLKILKSSILIRG